MPNQIPIHGSCDTRFSKVREIFQHSFDSGQEIGAAVSFVLDGESVIDLWGGYYDDTRTREWERDTLVNVYSVTKGMTAICAHQFIERGMLDIDAPVCEYWPEFAAAGKQDISVRWLLSHKAGLPAIHAPLPLDSLYDWNRMCGALAAQEPWWTPGEHHGYHIMTFGYLVGELIRRVSGENIGVYFRKNVAKPLDADFHIGLSEEHDARTSDVFGVHAGNRPAPNPPTDAAQREEFMRAWQEWQDPSTMQGAATLNPPQSRGAVNTREWRAAEIPSVNGHGNARALARIYGALARGGEIDGTRILESKTIDRAITEEAFGPDRLFGGTRTRFGLGFMLTHDRARLSPNPRAFGHAGAGGSLGMADPDTKMGFGFTMNNMQMGIVSAGSTAAVMIDAFCEALR